MRNHVLIPNTTSQDAKETLKTEQLPTLVKDMSTSAEHKTEWKEKAKLEISQMTAATDLSTQELEKFCKNTDEIWHDQEGLKTKFINNEANKEVRNILALATINEYEKIHKKIKPVEKVEPEFLIFQGMGYLPDSDSEDGCLSAPLMENILSALSPPSISTPPVLHVPSLFEE